jgi:hypothetical protein
MPTTADYLFVAPGKQTPEQAAADPADDAVDRAPIGTNRFETDTAYGRDPTKFALAARENVC